VVLPEDLWAAEMSSLFIRSSMNFCGRDAKNALDVRAFEYR